MAYGSGKQFERQPCAWHRAYTGHSTSTCPLPEAKAARAKRAAFRRAVRKLRKVTS